MAENSNIEWTDHTFNPWWGCTKVSQGCKNCYAENLSQRFGQDCWGPTGPRKMMSERYWRQPEKWQKEAVSAGARRRVFCASMADVFEGRETMPAESWTTVNEWRDRLYSLILATPNLDWLLLTKRPENVCEMIPEGWCDGLPVNVWIGTSVEDQEQADKRIPELRRIPAKVRFLSCEPLIGPVDLGRYLFESCDHCDGLGGWCPPGDPEGEEDCSRCQGSGFGDVPLEDIHWVIVGGESGPGKRPFNPDWGRRILADCKAAGVAFFGKQWDKVTPLPEDLMVREFPA